MDERRGGGGGGELGCGSGGQCRDPARGMGLDAKEKR